MAKEQKTQTGQAGTPLQPLTHERIAARAYQIYIERGCQGGHELDDWLQAQYELLQMPVEKIAELQPVPRGKKSRHMGIVEVINSALL